MCITTPDPCSIIPGTKARSSRAGPTKLTSMIACQSASDRDSNPPGLVSTPPALLTRMSSPPQSARQPADDAVGACGGSDVGRNEQGAVHGVGRRRPRGCDDAGAGELEATDDRRADAARAAGHQHALVRELVRRCGEPVGLGHAQASALLWMMINWVIRSSRRLK